MIPPLIEAARQVVAEHQYCVVDQATGQRVPETADDHYSESMEQCMERDPGRNVILDAITANLLCSVYDKLKDPSKLGLAVEKRGVIDVVNICWAAIA